MTKTVAVRVRKLAEQEEDNDETRDQKAGNQ